MSGPVAGPGPVARNADTEVFFDGTAEGKFLLLGCPDCGCINRPQAARCASCDANDLQPVPASGHATLVSWVVVHPRPREGEPPGPVTVPAIVELDEGPWWWSQLVDVDVEALTAGTRLTMEFRTPEGSETVPVFTPAAS